MAPADNEPSWLRGIKAKRPLEWLRALSYLLEAGLKKGWVCANDIPDNIYFERPNCIGAAFKDLRHFGFRKTNRTVKAKASRKHGRDLPVWELLDPMASKSWIGHIRSHILQVGTPRQMEFI